MLRADSNLRLTASNVDPEMEDEYAEAMNEYASMAQKQRPAVKLSSGEIFQLHAALVENIRDVVSLRASTPGTTRHMTDGFALAGK